MNKKNNKEIGCLGCVWNPFDSPSEPCPDAFKDHAQYCNAYSHRMKFKELGKKYGISTDRARTIWYREKKRAEWRLRHTGTEDITTIDPQI